MGLSHGMVVYPFGYCGITFGVQLFVDSYYMICVVLAEFAELEHGGELCKTTEEQRSDKSCSPYGGEDAVTKVT
jgi:hypothetical protein